MSQEEPRWLKKMPPVYHKARQLLTQLMMSTQKAERTIKYGMVAETENMIMSVMVDIAFADKYDIKPDARVGFITSAQMRMDEVKVRIRVLYDTRAMKKSGFSALTDLERDVDAQLEFWRSSTLAETRNLISSETP